MSRRISVPRVDSETAERVAVSPHEAEQRKRTREQALATRRIKRELTGPVSPDAAMNSRSVRHDG